MVVKSTDSGVTHLGFTSQFYYLVAMCLANYFTSVGFSVLICNMGLMLLPALLGCYEN